MGAPGQLVLECSWLRTVAKRKGCFGQGFVGVEGRSTRRDIRIPRHGNRTTRTSLIRPTAPIQPTASDAS